MYYLELSGYLFAAVLYALLALLLLLSWRSSRIAAPLLIASLAAALWLVTEAAVLANQMPRIGALGGYLDIVRVAAWYGLLIVILKSIGAGAVILRHGVVAVLLIAALLYSTFVADPLALEVGSNSRNHSNSVGLLAALFGLFLVEQVYRNTRLRDRDQTRYFCLGVGLSFVYDLFLYSHGLLVADTPDLVFALCGFAYAAGVPLIAVSAQRSTKWDVGIFVSRQVVFYSSSLLAVGAYLIAMSGVGYLIRSIDSNWGSALQVVFFVGALATLVWIIFSDQLRSSLKVWLHKNFYENKYDYREEWLRLIATLASDTDSLPIGERAVKALAQIVQSPGGVLWSLSPDGSCFRSEVAHNSRLPAAEIAMDHGLVEFLEERRWVLDLCAIRRDAEEYNALFPADQAVEIQGNALIVPLQHERKLLGFVELLPAERQFSLNYEDHDLLKTAGQQIASYLEQNRVAGLLSEARQFEAFSKFTAFVMHDLKNLIAQQSLMLQNAEKHKRNPDFVDDAFKTIANSVSRMQGLLEQLQSRSELGQTRKVNVADIVRRAVVMSSSREPGPAIADELAEGRVHADPERLLAVLGHIIRNAQEAAGAAGQVTVDLVRDGTELVALISDNGSGMDAEFIRDQLFQPFVSTKGVQGMGIGAYQAREYLRSIGGEVEVRSRRRQGSEFALRMPEIVTGE